MDIHESIDFVMQSQDLVGTQFYKTFFGRVPEAEQHFDGINMQRQAHVLTMSLLVIQQLYTKRYEATKEYLRYLGTQHKDRQIPLDLYPKWREAMLSTLSTFHGERWSDELEKQWCAAFDDAISLMLEGYETRVTI